MQETIPYLNAIGTVLVTPFGMGNCCSKCSKPLRETGFKHFKQAGAAAAPQVGGAEKIYLSVFSLRYEKAHEKKVTTVRRNPVVYSGGCINVHRLADGTLRLEFNRPRFYPDFSFRDFCLAAAQELLTIARLLGEEDSEE